MPAPATRDAFVEVLEKSGLVESERLRSFLEQTGKVASPRQLAARLVASGLLTQFQAEQVLLGKYRGYVLGKYRILERIGAGGHSTVYLGEHLLVKRRVALKVLPAARSDNHAAVTRFYREARAAGALDHPNLVKAHDIDQDNGLHFLVMDYVDGSSLQEIVARFGPLSIERAAHYVQQTARGLQAAYAAGLVHRDIKPANILLDRQGVIRVLDLGLARFDCDSDDPLTIKFENNNVLGTADYVAPEQALNSHAVDIRADIYSLGATFYFLLTGQTLFPKGKAAQKLIWHQTRQPTPIRELRPETPADLASLVERMIDKNRDQRYQTPNEVIEALQPWTSSPLPLPREEEMPRLSLAARAAGMSEGESTIHVARGPGTPIPAQRTAVNLVSPPPTMLAASVASSIRARSLTAMPTPQSLAEQIDTNVAPALRNTEATPPTPVPSVRPARTCLQRRTISVMLILAIGAFIGTSIRFLMDRFAAPAGINSSEQLPAEVRTQR